MRKAHPILPFNPESRKAVRPTPGQAPLMPMECTRWHYGWGGRHRWGWGDITYNVEPSVTFIYVLLCDLLYSTQKSKTSEDPGGQDSNS